MDRFIVGVKGATAPLWVNLKSNMDRFIDFAFIFRYVRISHLKSNMDRFIGSNYDVKYEGQDNLKSNMDRFIVKVCVQSLQFLEFKIQYG